METTYVINEYKVMKKEKWSPSKKLWIWTIIVLLIIKYMQNCIYNILNHNDNNKMKIQIFFYTALNMEYGQYFELFVCPQ